MKTLIHHGGALGDILLSLSCFGLIREDSSSVHFLGRQDVAELLNAAGWIDTFSRADSRVHASLYSEPDAHERKFLAAFDRAFVFTALSDSPVAAAVGSVIPRVRTISTMPPEGAGIHAASYRLAQLSRGERTLLPPVLKLSQAHRDGALALLRNSGCADGRLLAAIHPGSGGKKKRWPLDRYFELVVRLAAEFHPFFLFFSGPAEEREDKMRIDRFSLGRNDMTHIADGKLAAAAALLSRCSLYLGNDSGFSHLAAAMSCPAVALFGPTDPLVWGPAGSRVEVVSAGFPAPIDRIAVDPVFRTAASLLAQESTLCR